MEDTHVGIARHLLSVVDVAGRALRELATLRPPVTFAEVKNDYKFREAVREFQNRYETIKPDTDLPDADEAAPGAEWTLVAGWDEVYTFAEGVDEEGDPCWNILDAAGKVYDTEYSEEDAERVCDDLNREECLENLNGFPFAQSVGFKIRESETADFAAALFLVYEHETDGTIAGVDGGGYSMIDQHWAPLYFARCIENETLIETVDGPRRATKGA